MQRQTARQTATEALLRQSVPPLRRPDPDRVAEACARIASAPARSPLRDPRTFVKPLLRVAACLALLLGVAVLMRPAVRAPSVVYPTLPTVATFSDLADLMQRQELATSLASEIDNLAADLTDLTAALNERTLAILF